ncbi:MAG: hypothetical protein LWX56_00040 [Ignavibacteria bacterium]|nr:hypothetical protein [Ignavibacteria bacterium]
MAFNLLNSKDISDRGEILDGVRYKRGSIKLVEADGAFYVIVRWYLMFKIPFFKRVYSFKTREEAEHTFDRTKAHFYKIS